jgi:hypothetical protein
VAIIENTTSELVPVENTDKQKQDEDFELSRETLRDMIEQGRDALTKLIYIAETEQHPRAFEVVSTLINTISSSAKDLQILHTTKNKNIIANTPKQGINKKSAGPNTVTVDKAIVFSGTSSDFMKRLEERAAKENDE